MTTRWRPVATTGLAATAIGVTAAVLSAFPRELGHNIPQLNMEADYLKGFVTAAVLGLSLFIWPVKSIDRKALMVLWIAKCVVVLGFTTVAAPLSFDDLRSVSAYAPIGMFTALFRPVVGEVRNMFGVMAGLENVALLVLLMRAIWRAGSRLGQPIVQWAILFVVVWALAYGFTSYNLGSVARFKLQMLPILLVLLLYLGRNRSATEVWVLEAERAH